MHSDCKEKCCDEGPCCCAYLSTAGLYSIPVAATWLVTTLAQGVAIAASVPCLCKWVPAKTVLEGRIDIATEQQLGSFIAQMKVIRNQFGE